MDTTRSQKLPELKSGYKTPSMASNIFYWPEIGLNITEKAKIRGEFILEKEQIHQHDIFLSS